MTYSNPRRVVVASGTFAIVAFSYAEKAGVVELYEPGTESVALGHAKFVAPHVTEWSVIGGR